MISIQDIPAEILMMIVNYQPNWFLPILSLVNTKFNNAVKLCSLKQEIPIYEKIAGLRWLSLIRWLKEQSPPCIWDESTCWKTNREEYMENPLGFNHIGDPPYNRFQFVYTDHILSREISKVYKDKPVEGLGIYCILFNKEVINTRLQNLYEENPDYYSDKEKIYLEESASFTFFGRIVLDKEYPQYSELKIFYFEYPKIGETFGFKVRSKILDIGNQNTYEFVKIGESPTEMNKFPIYYYNDPFEESTNLNILNGKFIVGKNVKFVYFKEQVSIVENFLSHDIMSTIY